MGEDISLALIVCTYKRPDSLIRLLKSVYLQEVQPAQLIIVDGSDSNETNEALQREAYTQLEYFLVDPKERGLTKQRNFGIAQVAPGIELVAFLDDDIVLRPHYFSQLLQAFKQDQNAVGVAGYITNEVQWSKGKSTSSLSYVYDGWYREDGKRYRLRSRLGLLEDIPPGKISKFGHGRPQSYLPPTGKNYEVDSLMGGLACYKKSIFSAIQFSEYFWGYGLYEDMEFSLRAAKLGSLKVCTSASLEHLHEPMGRPNSFRYGYMVVWNGWAVWRLAVPEPGVVNILKWTFVSLLLALLRVDGSKNGFQEFLGRMKGLVNLMYKKPKL
jgi:GT2 family glycosyltransferase